MVYYKTALNMSIIIIIIIPSVTLTVLIINA